MATTVVSPQDAGVKMSWGAIFGGTIVTLGVWMLLHTLGLAAGLTAIDPQDQGSLRGVGIGTGVWSVIAPLLALFVGGFVAAYTGGLLDKMAGAIHGLVVWGLTSVAAAVLLGMAIAATLSAGVKAGAAAISGGASALGAVGIEDLGINVDDALRPVNQRLMQQGLPPVSASQVRAVTNDAIRQGIERGRLDRQVVVESLVRNTGMAQPEAEQLTAQIEQQFNQRLAEFQQRARQTALTAADRTGKALWGAFVVLLLGAMAAAGGALIGAGRGATFVLSEEEEPRPMGPPTRHIPVEGRP